MTELSKTFSMSKLAQLAQLSLGSDEQNIDNASLHHILELADEISKINTDHVQPATHPFAEIQPLRVDEVTETNQREQFQTIAPQVEEGLYLVPPIIE